MSGVGKVVGAGILAVAMAGCVPQEPRVQVCVEVSTGIQVDEDHCEEGKSEYNPERYGIIWLRQSLVTNQDAVVEPETDETRSSKPSPKVTTKKPTPKASRR